MKTSTTDNKQHALDLAIKAKYRENHPFVAGKDTNDEYIMSSNRKSYERYLPNSEWADFLDDMQRNYNYAFKKYKEGDGGETLEKQYPPKMACYGSSSRFIFLESREMMVMNEDFFEKKLETHVGGCANLDGYLSTEDGYVFIEAKCREIYGYEGKKISSKYIPLYKFLKQKELLNFSESQHIEKGVIDPNHVDVTFYSMNNKKIVHTDIKQLLCHFLGISAYLLENPNGNKKVSFLYLIFEPIESENCIFTSYKMFEKILKIRKTIVPQEFDSLDISSIFKAVLDFQANNLAVRLNESQILEIKEGFTFDLINQIEYKKRLAALIKK